MEDADICDNWEQIEENSDVFEKQFEKLKLKVRRNEELSSRGGSGPSRSDGQGDNGRMVLDSTTSESLRTQYAPPEPKPFQILSRPKRPDGKTPQVNGIILKTKTSKTSTIKTYQQREQEYAEARKRILGDVRFVEEEREAEMEATMSPAEILKMKISEVMQGETFLKTSDGENTSERSRISPGKGDDAQETLMPEETIPKDFPVSKLESAHIVRQPRGPDGSTGFNKQNRLN